MKSKKKFILRWIVLGGALVFGALLILYPEVYAAPHTTLIVNETNDELNNDSDCSLREAIRATNLDTTVGGCHATAGTDAIRLTSGETYKLELDSNNDDADTDDTSVTGDLDILGDIQFNTGSTGRAIIAGKLLWKERILEVKPNITVTFTRIEFRNGNAKNGLGGGGLGIGTGANVTLSSSVVADNKAEGNGGGILSLGNLTIENSTVSSNKNTEHDGGGGGIYSNASLTLNNVNVSSNESEGDGLSDDDGGGGIFNDGGILTITNSTIQGNNIIGGFDDGGGIYSPGGTTTITSSSIVNNTGSAGVSFDTNDGVGIFATGTVSIDRTLIAGNIAKSLGDGAGAVLGGGEVSLTNSIVRDNKTANGNGGGLHIGSAFIENTTISGNQAKGGVVGFIGDGGGLLATGKVTLLNVTLSGNKADRSGGGLYATDFAEVKLLNVTITGNDANNDHTTGGDGGGIFINYDVGVPTVFLRNTIIAGNTTAGAFSSSPDCSGTLDTDPANIIDITNNCFGISDAITDDPKLNALANNGGFKAGDGLSETIKTHSLKSDSPAIDAAVTPNCLDLDNFAIGTDERGQNFPRPVDGDKDHNPVCDLGAFEFGSAPFTATPTITATPTRTNTPIPGASDTPTPTPTHTLTFTPSATATDECVDKPSKPDLDTPVADGTVHTLRPVLKWFDAQCADKYKVYIKHFFTGFTADKATNVTDLKYKTKKLDAGKYKWFVKACNDFGCKKSEKRTLTLAP